MTTATTTSTTSQRRPSRWIAALLGLVLVGLGQTYNGQLRKGMLLYALCLACGPIGLGLCVFLPDRWFAVGFILSLASVVILVLGGAAEAWLQARKWAGTPQPSRWYNHWYVYVLLWLLLGAVLFPEATGYLKREVLHAYKVPSAGMEPGLLVGDMLMADMTWYHRHQPRVGDIAVFPSPQDPAVTFVKRIGALPGDTVTLPDDAAYTIPPERVWLLGDNAQNSFDSRAYGPVPISDLQGRVRLIYFSVGEDGTRWDRVGLVPGRDGQP